MKQSRAVFETMPVPKALATLAVPTIISQLITMLYNLADTFFIGKTNDPLKVAAASLAFVMFFIMNALSNLFGIGGGSLISRLLGEKKDGEAKNVCSFSFYGTIAITLIYSLISLIFMEPMLRLMGATDNTMIYAKDYCLWVVVIGGIPSALSLTMSHLLRSEGYAKESGFGLGMGGVLNIILDPIFMFVLMEPGQEVAGAAIATTISNTCSVLYFLIIFLRMRKTTVLSIAPRRVFAGVKYLKEILAVGFPSAIASFLACAANMVSNILVAAHGDVELAALGIVKKIDMLPMNVGAGLCQGMMPLVAYNYAAKNYPRMRAFTACARNAGVIFAAVCIVVFEVFTGGIMKIFIDEPQTVAFGVVYLRIACLATPLMISSFQMNYTFQAMGKGRQALILSACRQGLVYIPLAFVMNHFWGAEGVIAGQIVADGITFTVSYILYRRLYHRLVQEMPEPVSSRRRAD